MEVASWKKLILSWVNNSGLLEKPSMFLDQTDLDVFFTEYRKLMMRVTIPQLNIRDFLKVNYPAFQTHFFEDNEICSADYVYIYCLLLHYSCVVCKDEKFQSICMNLTGSQQESIASLFSHLVHKDAITRVSLKNTLRDTVPQSPIEFMNLGSPIRTPLKTSPSTPSTKLLEERSRELISLKAQLETERYERNFLEMQMKETEGNLKKANQQQKAYIVEIKQLKEKLLYGDEQNIPLNREKKDVFTLASHQKQIHQLEDKICSLNIEVDALTRDRSSLQQKNGSMEKELTVFREKFHEQRILNEDIQADLQNKERIIADLESVNEELKMFIKEIKPSTDLNSTDSLDFSFNSSNSRIGESPENLAKTVVEVQLREKEAENLTLRTSLTTLEEKVQKIAQEIVDFMQKNSTVIDTDIPKIIPNDDNLQYVVFAFVNAAEKLLDREVEMKRTLGKAEAEQSSLVDTIARLNDECARMREEMLTLTSKEKSTEEKLRQITEDFERNCVEIENVNREVYSLRSINERYEKIIEENEALEKELTDEINDLKSKLSISEKLNTEKDELNRIIDSLKGKLIELEKSVRKKKEELEKFQCTKDGLEKANSVLTSKISEQNSIIKSLQEIKESRNLEISQLSEQLKDQRTKNEQLKANVESLMFEKEELTAEVDTKLHDMKDLKEINRISGEKITSLEDLLEDSRMKISQFNKDLEELRKKLEESQREKESLSEEKTSLGYQIKDSEILVDELRNQIASFEAQEIEFSKKIDSLNMEIEVYKTDNRKIHSKKSELLKQSDMQKTQTLHLLKEIECHKREIATLSDDLREKENLFGAKEAANEEIVAGLEEKRRQQRVELEDSEKKIRELTEKFDEEKKKCSESEDEKQKNLLEVERLSQAFAEVNEKLRSDAEALVKLKEQLELSTSKSSEINLKLKEVQQEVISKDKSVKDLEEEKTKLISKLSEMEEILTKNAAKIQELENQIQKEAMIKEEISRHHEQELSSLQRALAETYEKNEELSANIVNLEKVKKQMESLLEAEIAEKHSLNKKISNEEKAQEQLKEELQCVKKDLMERKSHCAKLTNEISQLNEKVEALSFQLGDQKSENIDLREKIKFLDEKEVDSKVRVMELQGEVDKLAKEIQDLEVAKMEESGRVNKLTKEVAEKETLVQELRTSLESQKTRFEEIENELKKEISDEKSQNCELQQKISYLETLENDLKTLRITLSEKNLSNDALTAEIDELKEIINSKTSEIADFTQKLEARVAESEEQVKQQEELKLKLQEKTTELLIMEQDRKTVNEKAKELLEKQQNFEIKCSQYEERIKLLCESKSKAIDGLQREISGLEKRNIDLSEKVKNLEGDFAMKKRECEDLSHSKGEILNENAKLKEEIQSIESQNDEITQKVLDSDGEIQNLQHEIKKLLSKNHEVEKSLAKLSDENSSLEATVAEKNGEILNMRIEMKKKVTELSTDSVRIENLLQEVEKYKSLEVQVKKLESLEIQEKEINERLMSENSILQAKLYKHRQMSEEKEKSWESERETFNRTIAEVNIAADERISDNKREMEGKLQKMKDKMKALCNAELDKTKLRYEREYTVKMENAEKQVKTLSKQIASLNCEKLELTKEYSNLKRMMGSTGVTKKPIMSQMNLNMEDEEGEQFNNTYLMRDVKVEQASFYGRESLTKEELDWRNSRQPPHLKSQYAAQYDIDNCNDDATSIGDGNVHDDSMSSLLYAGQRKKLSGTTSYKRPGPPTPSKNGGRLSLGGTGEPSRQILKEINDGTKQQTPSALRTLFGRRSLARDENPTASPAARFKSIFRNKRTNK